MSDEKGAKAEETDGPEQGPGESPPEELSVFDLFEPPPEVDPNHLGPIPIVPEVDLPGSLFDDGARISVPNKDTGTGVAGVDAIEGIDHFPVEDLLPDNGPLSIESTETTEGSDDPVAQSKEESRQTTDAGALLDDLFGDETELDPGTKLDETDLDLAGPQEVSVPIVPVVEAPADLPHWTDPPTGQVPAVVAADPEDEVWSDLSGPRWHGEGPEWAGDDLADVFGFTPAAEQGVDAALIDDTASEAGNLSNAGPPQRAPIPRQTGPAQAAPPGGGRNLPQAILVGGLLGGLALLAFWLGNRTTVGLITVIAVLGGLELFNKMREVGVHPATLLGTVASGAMPLATYNQGPAGFMMVAALMVVFGALWYIVGADSHRPALNMGLTMLGVMWVGGLASFAVLIVRLPDGISMLLFAVVVTIVFDTGAYAGGRAFGKTPFHSSSPNKTWEGTIIGVIAAVGAAGILGLFLISQFSDNLIDALIVGLVVGILAPIGDLTESMVKRDLGVKDMGTLLPGHGGILDRVDGLLFVLPGVYYLALILLP